MPSLSLRNVSAADREFLCAVYSSTRTEELATTDWTHEQKAAFCQQQFEAQDAHYLTHYPNASREIILVDGEPVGRLYVDRWPKEIRIMEITLLPEARGHGVGGRLLADLQSEARNAGKILSIHVERFNPALTLYSRLGFVLAEDKGVYLLLHWEPDASQFT